MTTNQRHGQHRCGIVERQSGGLTIRALHRCREIEPEQNEGRSQDKITSITQIRGGFTPMDDYDA